MTEPPASLHQRLGAACQRCERIAGNVQTFQKISARRFHIAPRKLVLVRKGNRMNQKIQRPPSFFKSAHHMVYFLIRAHIAGKKMLHINLPRQRLHPFLKRLPLIGERYLCARSMQNLRDPPRDGALIRDPQNETPLAFHKSVCIVLCHISQPLFPTILSKLKLLIV